MSPQPLVSIITPSYNQARFLEQCMLSVLDQDYAKLEYIVMDGASTDESQAIITRYAQRLVYTESIPDHGQAHAINKGLRLSKGEIIGWLNADDILLPGVVSKVVREFQTHPQVDVVYGRLERINEQGQLVSTPLLPKDQLNFDRSLVIGECIVNQPGSFWRRRAMEFVGLLDESLIYSLDYEYWIRLALAGSIFLHLPDVLAYFRLSPTSKTVSNTSAMAEEQLEVLEKTLLIPDLAEQLGIPQQTLLRQAHKARARVGLHAVYGYWKNGEIEKAWQWLMKSLYQDPWVIFETRWRKLAMAGISRRLSKR